MPLAWPGSGRAVVEDDALLRVEGEGADAGDVDPAGRVEVGEAALGLAGVEGVGDEAEQAEDRPRGRWRGPCR